MFGKLLVFVLITPLSAFAVKWVERNNGGFTLRCENQARQILDLYEAQAHGLNLDQSHNSSVHERVQYLLTKLAEINPSRANLYRGWYADFDRESQVLPNVDFAALPDLGYAVKPKDCSFEITVVQREPSTLRPVRYQIAGDIWNSLDVINQAALVMHELIYREVATAPYAHTTSENTRYFNGLLNSVEFKNLSAKDYITLLQELHFPTADYSGYSVRLAVNFNGGEWQSTPLSFYDNGGLKWAYLSWENPFVPGKMSFLTPGCLGTESEVRFYSNGQASEIKSFGGAFVEANCKPSYLYSVSSTVIQMKDDQWKFDSEGHLLESAGTLTFAQDISPMQIQGIRVIHKSTDRVMKIRARLMYAANKDVKTVQFEEDLRPCFNVKTQVVQLLPQTGAAMLQWDVSSFKTAVRQMHRCAN